MPEFYNTIDIPRRRGKKVFWKSLGRTFLVFGIILALGYGVAAAAPRLFLDRYVMAEVVVFLSLALVGMFCFPKVWNYGGYTIFAKKMVSRKDFLEQDDAVKEARAADVQIQDKDISKEELRSRKYEEKEGKLYLSNSTTEAVNEETDFYADYEIKDGQLTLKNESETEVYSKK